MESIEQQTGHNCLSDSIHLLELFGDLYKKIVEQQNYHENRPKWLSKHANDGEKCNHGLNENGEYIY